jgi:hypothetical protein
MGWESNTHREDEKYGMGIYSGNLKGRDTLEVVNKNVKMNLKLILK